MRRSILGGMVAVLVLGLSMPAVAGADEGDRPPWQQGRASGRRQPAGPGAEGSTGSLPLGASGRRQPAGPGAEGSTGPLPLGASGRRQPAGPGAARPPETAAKAGPAPLPRRVDAAAERQREEAAWLRRQAVCRKLLEIALETNDTELQRLAEQLDERIWALYLQRTAHLPASRAVVENDEQILDRHLKPESLLGRPIRVLPPGSGKNHGDSADVVEDKR